MQYQRAEVHGVGSSLHVSSVGLKVVLRLPLASQCSLVSSPCGGFMIARLRKSWLSTASGPGNKAETASSLLTQVPMPSPPPLLNPVAFIYHHGASTWPTDGGITLQKTNVKPCLENRILHLPQECGVRISRPNKEWQLVMCELEYTPGDLLLAKFPWVLLCL